MEYVAQAVDAAGNVSFFTGPVDITFDRTMAPPIVSLDPTSSASGFGPGAQTTLNQIIIDGTAKPGATVILVGTPFFTTANSSGKFTITGVAVKPGPNSFDVRESDIAGNMADSTFVVTMHDITPPTVSLTLVNDTGFDAHDVWTNDPTTRVVVDDASPITLLQASINGGPWLNVLTRLTSDVVTLDIPLLTQINGGTLPDQQLVIAIQAGDAAGNVAQTVTLPVLLTRTPPPANVAPSLVSSSDTGASPFDNVTRLANPVIRLFAQRGSLVTFYEGATQIGQAFSTGVATITPTPLADGTHSITATIEDQAGNVSGHTPVLTLTIDTVAPAVPTLTLDAAQQDPVRANYTVAAQVTLHGTTEPGATVQLVGFAGIVPVTADSGGNFAFANVPLAVGDNLLTVQAADLAGNTSQLHATMTRGQLLPPAISAHPVGSPTGPTATVFGSVSSETSVTTFSAGFDRRARLSSSACCPI